MAKYGNERNDQKVLMKTKTKGIDFIPLLIVLGMVILLVIPAIRTMASSAGGTPAAQQSGSDEGYYLTWEECTQKRNITDWNWNDAADAIEEIAFHAADLYEKGDMKGAYEYAKATYWGYFETTGFERNVLTYISGSRVSADELQFTTFRKAVKKELGIETVRQEAQTLTDMLHEDAIVLSPEGATGSVKNSRGSSSSGANVSQASSSGSAASGSAGGAAAVFAGSFGIILREGLEAILVVGAIIAYLVKTGNKKALIPVYTGAALAIGCSFIMAAILGWLKSINPETTMSQEIMEGFAALAAVVVLFYVSNWMVSKSESAAWEGYIKGKVSASAEKGKMFALGFTAWLAVFREGAEVILFYQPMLSEGYPGMVWTGFLTGCAALVVIFLIIRFLSIKIPVKPFFIGTGILMAAMTICFLGSGIKELMEGGVFDDFAFMLASPPWLSWIPYNDVLDVLGIYPLVGTIVPQLILTGITIVTFIIVFRRNARIRAASADMPLS